MGWPHKGPDASDVASEFRLEIEEVGDAPLEMILWNRDRRMGFEDQLHLDVMQCEIPGMWTVR